MLHSNGNDTRVGYAGAMLGVASCCQLTSWLHFTVMKAGCWSEIHVTILSWLAPIVAVFLLAIFFSVYAGTIVGRGKLLPSDFVATFYRDKKLMC